MFIITISRQTGSLGEELALELSRTYGLPLIDRKYVRTNWLPKIASSNQLHLLTESPKAHLTTSTEGIPFYLSIENRLKETVKESGAIILGLGAQVIFQNNPQAYHIRVIAPIEQRMNFICEHYGIEPAQAQKFLHLSDRKRRKYLLDLYAQDWENNDLYHLTLNTGKVKIKDAMGLIASLLPEELKKDVQILNPVTVDGRKQKSFVHQSEIDFVKVLDMYHIEWKYEPTTFPIEWDAEGNVTKAFTPDFFLPAYQTYVELTTMNQRYVTEKNRKVRKLKALYPEINVTILYKKDIHKLLKKFGVV